MWICYNRYILKKYIVIHWYIVHLSIDINISTYQTQYKRFSTETGVTWSKKLHTAFTENVVCNCSSLWEIDIKEIFLKLGPHDACYVFVVHHVWICLKRFVESDTYSLLWCVNLPPNWWTRCDEWTNDTSTQIRHIFSYTRCANHDAQRITNTNHASCGPSFTTQFSWTWYFGRRPFFHSTIQLHIITQKNA